jgi:DNA helicase-2/ATP-dependent DNA helicase PcrA
LYEREKKLAHCFDFDDLLLETLKLFRTNNIFKEQFQARVRHILIDEYQDTNHVQHALLKAIALRDQTFALDSLCVVGDEDQAIYSWRGATVSNIINFARDFPTTVRFTIQQNYRSAQSILDVANTLIDHNTQRTPKKLWSERTGKDRVRLLTSSSSYQESDIVATFTKLQQARSPQRSIAVLYRSHYQSRAIEEALIRHSLPYVIIGGIRFYERQEIKDLLAYLRLVANPFDRISFMRVINVPARGLGDKFQEQFFELWDQHPQDHFKTVAELMYDQLSPSKQTALRSFIDCFASLQASDNAHELLNTIIARTTYFSYLATAFEAEESTNKKDNVKELLYAVRAVEDRNNGTMSVAQFLDEVALLQDALMQQDTSDQQCIRLMTLHAAKGLEFDTVILTGLEEGVLPSNHNLYDPMAIEEERRLLYVGITRARERLLITHARYRAQYGTMNDQLPSRFIKEIIKEQIHHHDCSSLGIMQIYHYLSEWLAQAVVKSQPITTKQTKKEKNFTENKQSLSSALYLKQRVRHEVFGIGTIERIETKSDGQMVYLTVAFKTSTKKVAAAFVKPIS